MDYVAPLNENGFVQIKKFLPYAEARWFRHRILTTTDYRAWNLLTRPYFPLTRIKDDISTSVIDKTRHRQARAADKRGEFAFSFYRSSNKHVKNKNFRTIVDKFSDRIKSNICPQLALDGTMRDCFFAKFTLGQFIGYHSDGSAGKYAFVYQLSSGWRSCYGGQLVLYPRKGKFYRKVIEPEFNSLVLMKLDHPMFHSVNKLNNPKHKHRITISGWLE